MRKKMFKNIRIVLVNPSHPGNIGAAARAMKTMGVERLYLVNPERFPDIEAYYRASRADDVVNNAVVTSSLEEALKGSALVLGTSARDREMPQPMLNPRQAAEKVISEYGGDVEIAMVFGCEKYGLSNEDLLRCHYHIKIPSVDNYSSLNLAAAVQVITYELRMAQLSQLVAPQDVKKNNKQLSTVDELEGLYKHIEEAMIAVGFFDPQKPRRMMSRIRQIFNRAQLDKDDVDLLRGMMKSTARSGHE